MATYKPSVPYNVPLALMIPTYQNELGVNKKVYPEPCECPVIFGSFRTFGGTEKDVNGILAVENTAVIETWFRPDITSNCEICVLSTGAIYEIIGEPENISMRNQFLRFKVRGIKGGV